MFSCDVEVMHRVSHEIAVLHDVRRGIDVEREAETALFSVAARLQAHFHHAFAHRGFVAECRGVADGIDHSILFELTQALRG